MHRRVISKALVAKNLSVASNLESRPPRKPLCARLCIEALARRARVIVGVLFGLRIDIVVACFISVIFVVIIVVAVYVESRALFYCCHCGR